MEGRIGNHGNQKESEEGQQEETLIGRSQQELRGRQKRPLSFFADEFSLVCLPLAVRERASRFSGKASDTRRSRIECRVWAQTLRQRSPLQSQPLSASPLAFQFRCARCLLWCCLRDCERRGVRPCTPTFPAPPEHRARAAGYRQRLPAIW